MIILEAFKEVLIYFKLVNNKYNTVQTILVLYQHSHRVECLIQFLEEGAYEDPLV